MLYFELGDGYKQTLIWVFFFCAGRKVREGWGFGTEWWLWRKNQSQLLNQGPKGSHQLSWGCEDVLRVPISIRTLLGLYLQNVERHFLLHPINYFPSNWNWKNVTRLKINGKTLISRHLKERDPPFPDVCAWWVIFGSFTFFSLYPDSDLRSHPFSCFHIAEHIHACIFSITKIE